MTPSKTILTTFYTVYYSIVMVMLVFALIVLYLNYSGQNSVEQDDSFAQLLTYALYVLAPLGVAAGHYIFKQMLSNVDPALSVRNKIGKLQVATLIRSACMEMPALFGAVAAFVTGNNSFLLFTAIIAVLFIIWRPTLSTMTEDLSLSSQERIVLEDPNGQIE